MIKRILLNQAKTVQKFKRAAMYLPSMSHDDEGHATLETFEQLETEAERVRAMVGAQLYLGPY